MTVYVDQYMVNLYTRRQCHLFSYDSDETELHELAAEIGLAPGAFQRINDTGKAPWHNCYMVDEVQRVMALKAGAEVVGLREHMDRTKKLREINGEPCPNDRGFGPARVGPGAGGGHTRG